MAEHNPSRTRSVIALATLVIGCIACCADPLLGAPGLAAASTAALAWTGGNWPMLAVIGGVALGAAYLWMRRSRVHATPASSCNSMCAVDRSCCGPAAGGDGGATVCLLSADELNDRVQAFQALFAIASVRSERSADGVTWRLQNVPGVETESRRLAGLESHCCSGLGFDICIEHGEVVWRISPTTERARGLLDFFYRLPTLTAGEGVPRRA